MAVLPFHLSFGRTAVDRFAGGRVPHARSQAEQSASGSAQRLAPHRRSADPILDLPSVPPGTLVEACECRNSGSDLDELRYGENAGGNERLEPAGGKCINRTEHLSAQRIEADEYGIRLIRGVVIRDGMQRWHREDWEVMLVGETFGSRPCDPQSRETAGPISYHNALELVDACVAEHLRDHRDDLRGMLPGADGVAPPSGSPGAERNARDVRGSVDGEPRLAQTPAVSSTTRRDGSTS